MSAYQGIVDEYNDMVRGQVAEARSAMDEGISDGLATQLEAIKEKADEYSEKFSALAEGGIGEIAGLQGLKSTYKAVQDARAKWKKFRGDSSTDGRYLGGRNTADATAERDSLPDDVLGRVRRTLQGEDDLGVAQLERTGITTSEEGERASRAERQRLEREQQVAEPEESDIQAQIDAQPPAREEIIAGERDEPVNITDDQIDSMVNQALDDVNEGVGIENTPSSYSVGGIQYGKTGSGADVKRPPVNEDEPSPASEATLDAQPQVAVSQPLPSTEPIPVSKIGVKASAQEFSARADQATQPVASTPPQDLKSIIRQKYKGLSADKQQEISAKVDSGELDGNDLQAVNAELDRLRPAPAVAEPTPSFPEGFASDIEQMGRSVEASVRATADPVRFRPRVPESEGAQLTAEERGAIQPEFIQGARSDIQATARTGLRRLLGLGGGEGEVGGLEMLASVATPLTEAVAVGAGIVSVVDGLVHLFHPPHNTPKPLGHLGNIDPQVSSTLTSKYASAIPTLDNAHELGGFASF